MVTKVTVQFIFYWWQLKKVSTKNYSNATKETDFSGI
jgi:hypothetical protein